MAVHAGERPTHAGRRRPSLLAGALLMSLLAGCGGGSDSSSSPVAAVSSCDQPATLGRDGNVVLPAEATSITGPDYVEEDLGLLTGLYPDLDTSTDAFYASLPCEPSIGGDEPPDLPEETPEQAGAEAFITDFEDTTVPGIVESLLDDPLPSLTSLSTISASECSIRTEGTEIWQPTPCDSRQFLDESQPFEGRDIIYVHGLATEHLKDKLLHPPSAGGPSHPVNRVWPQDAGEFLNAGGYFRSYAENYWKSHVEEHLGKGWQWLPGDPAPVYKPKNNRYLLVSWSSNQTLEYAQDALINQIHQAITANTNVVTPPGYPPRWRRPFCANGCILISHSTGSLIVSTTMAKAELGWAGPGGENIVKRMAAHISFDGAISGSRIATIGLAAGMLSTPIAATSNLVCDIVDDLFGLSNTCNADTSFLASSILRDLVPMVSQEVWGPLLSQSPVPTVTFAAGHPLGGFIVTGFFLPGIDDGVVTMNSACGNPRRVLPGLVAPGGVTVSSLPKSFDFAEHGGRLLRNKDVFFAQHNWRALPPGVNYLAAACSPWLSPTGMVLPVLYDWAGTSFDARARYPNHYSFVQSIGEHSHDGGKPDWPSTLGQPASTQREYKFYYGTLNLEESSAVTDPAIYTRQIDNNGTHLVKPIPVREEVRGRMVGFNLPFNIGGCRRDGVLNYYCKRWLWKRTYHLLDKWEMKQSSHYAYEFVGRR